MSASTSDVTASQKAQTIVSFKMRDMLWFSPWDGEDEPIDSIFIVSQKQGFSKNRVALDHWIRLNHQLSNPCFNLFSISNCPAVETVPANMFLFSEKKLIPKQWDGKLQCILIHLTPGKTYWKKRKREKAIMRIEPTREEIALHSQNAHKFTRFESNEIPKKHSKEPLHSPIFGYMIDGVK
ncbi:hypothetical protein C8R44DRAFT_731249 [Mycena epipterygia]|nr:hypothetical protein C8R44DRAFT_731249 [Mycena epipterygia]